MKSEHRQLMTVTGSKFVRYLINKPVETYLTIKIIYCITKHRITITKHIYTDPGYIYSQAAA